MVLFHKGCEKDVQSVWLTSPQEYIYPFKEKMETFILSGKPCIKVSKVSLLLGLVDRRVFLMTRKVVWDTVKVFSTLRIYTVHICYLSFLLFVYLYDCLFLELQLIKNGKGSFEKYFGLS